MVRVFAHFKFKGNSLLSDAAVYLVSNILNSAIPFALLPVLTRYLSPAEYGEVAMFQTLLIALGAFTGFSVVGAVSRKYYDKDIVDSELKNFIASGLQVLFASSSVVFLVLLLNRERLSDWLGLQPVWLFYAVLMSAAMVVIQLRLGQWQVRQMARKYGILQISLSLLNMAISLILVVVLMQGAAGRIWAQVGASVAFAIVALLLLRRDNLLACFTWRPIYVKEILAFGVPLVPHIAGVFFLSSVDRFVINEKLGLADAGVYMVAVQLSSAMALVFDALNKAYVPWLFECLKRNIELEKEKVVRYTYGWFAAILSFSVFSFFFGPAVVECVAGNQYKKAGDVIGWLFLGQAFGGMYLMVTNYIFFSKRTGLLSLATISSGLVNLALLLMFIPLVGIEGAAVAFCIAMAIRFFLTWWVAHIRHPMPWFGSF